MNNSGKFKEISSTSCYCIILLEAVVQRYSVKKVFLEISQNSQENVRPSFISLFATLMDKTLVGAGESAGAFIWRFSVNKFTGNSQEIACVGVSF